MYKEDRTRRFILQLSILRLTLSFSLPALYGKVVAVSLREMLDSAVEVLLGGVRIYRATGGRSSIGMVFLPPGGAFPPEVVQNSQISFVVLAGKITVEIGCGGGVDSGHRGPPDQKAVYGASQGTIVFLEKGDAFSVKNASRTTAQLVYLLV
jgi:mannose-6-phosphate isomerase-like protein (cupin superfamily)